MDREIEHQMDREIEHQIETTINLVFDSWVNDEDRISFIDIRGIDIEPSFSKVISLIGKLEALEGLRLRNTELTRVDLLRNISHLKISYLDLSGNYINNLNGIDTLLSLEELTLDYNEFEDLYPVGKLINLKNLSLEGTPVKDITPLTNLKNLRHLNLRNTKVTDLSPIDITRLDILT